MSNKRAEIRRTNKEHTYSEGIEDGTTMMLAITLVALHDEFGFTSFKNGKGRLDRIVDVVAKELEKLDEEPTQMNVNFYINLLKEKTGLILETDD